MSETAPVFEFKNIIKKFGAVVANDGVSFRVEQSSIHGVAGENGAGKSTIMKILYGMYPPTSGDIHLRGTKHKINSPLEAIKLGIGMVHQHFMLVPTLRVWENIVLGSEPSRFFLNAKAIVQELDELQKSFGFDLDLNALTEDLCVGEQQRIEILKLLYRKADILILDEPTAVLTPQEVVTLFERLRFLQKKNKTIVIITHKLNEILEFTESVTVMRRAKVIGTVKTNTLDETSLAEMIVGRKLLTLPERKQTKNAQPIIEVKDLSLEESGRTLLKEISLSVSKGEILGIAGVEGNGQHELVEILANVNQHYQGEVLYKNAPLNQMGTYESHQKGISVIPPDRHREALILDFPVWENFLLGHHFEKEFTSGAFIKSNKCLPIVNQMIEQFDVRPTDCQLPIRSLSGGNQQKVITGREIHHQVELLIAAHPTRGVDIGAIEFIHSLFLKYRDAGAAIILVSSELEEVLALSDRIIVLYEGRIQGEVTREKAVKSQIGLWMTGGE